MFQMALSRGLLKPHYNSQLLLQSFRCLSSGLNFDEMVKKNKVVVFMKGTPKAPRCGFSNAVVQIFKLYGVEFDSYDVLSNEEMRQGIKEFTSWPTIPQVFINGEFVGGCDILTQMHYDKKLSAELEKAGVKYEAPSSQKSIRGASEKKDDDELKCQVAKMETYRITKTAAQDGVQWRLLSVVPTFD